MATRRIKRYYQYQAIDLNGLDAVRTVFNQRFSASEFRRYRLVYPSDEIEVSTIDDVKEIFVRKGPTSKFTIVARSTGGRFASFDSTSLAQIVVEYHSKELNVETEIEKVERAVSLRPLQRLVQSGFIAHGFDDKGKVYAQQVAEFLRLLGLTTTTGEYFEPTSVSEKVKKRILEGDIFIAIVTPQDDRTWIIQETTYADSLNKHPFVLVETTVDHKRGLRGDQEEIFFPENHVSETFIKILQGLRRLRGDAI